MKLTTKVIFAAATVLAASSAFAQSDGQPDNAWLMDPPSSQLTPAPTTAQKPAPAASDDSQSSNAPSTAPAAYDGESRGLPAYYHGEYPHA